jgi:hypothetical protein
MLHPQDVDLPLPVGLGDEDVGIWRTTSLDRLGIDPTRFEARQKFGVENFRLLIQLLDICHKIMYQLYSVQARKLDRNSEQCHQVLQILSADLQDWKNACPSHLQTRPGNCCQLPHACVLCCVCPVHRKLTMEQLQSVFGP